MDIIGRLFPDKKQIKIYVVSWYLFSNIADFSNVFMTFAWYGHLKMRQEFSWFAALPLIGVIAFSWAIAFLSIIKQKNPTGNLTFYVDI